MSACTLVRSATAAFALLLISSCAAMQPLKPTDRAAVVKAGEWGKIYRGGYVELAAINGGEPHWRVRSEMEVTPGILNAVYYVYLCTQGEKHCTSVAETPISFTAQAGHTYQVRAREQTNGSNRFWVWVVDEADQHVVAGNNPGTGSEKG